MSRQSSRTKRSRRLESGAPCRLEQLEPRCLLDGAAGPQVIAHWPDGPVQAADHIDLTFNEPIAPATLAAGAVQVIAPGPGLLGTYDAHGHARGIDVVGTRAYVACVEDGLLIVDMSDPSNPVKLGGYNTNGWSFDVAVSGNLAYVADYDTGVQIIDVSNPSAPVWVGSYNTSGHARGVAVSGSMVYVADQTGGLQIIDASDPSAPVRVGGYSSGSMALDVAVAGNLAYVADKDNGLLVIDVSNPTAPTRLGGYDTDGYSQGVALAGTLAYVADYDNGVEILDVSNPAAPVWLGNCPTPGHANAVAVSGNLALVASTPGGLKVFDVSDPSAPVARDGYGNPNLGQDVAVVGDTAYLTDGNVRIVKVTGLLPVFAGVTAMSDTTYRLDLTSVLPDGVYQIRVGPDVKDLAGNSMDQDGDGVAGEAADDVYSFNLTIDTTPPLAPAAVAFGQDGGASNADGLTAATELTFTWSAPADASGIASYDYRWDGGPWVTTAEAASAALPAEEGQHTFEVRATDNVGNTGPAASRTVVVDVTPPEAPTALRLVGTVLHWDQASDANGIWKYQYRVDGGQWTDTTALEAATGLATGASGLFDVQAVDRAGNVGPAATATLTAELGPRIVACWPDAPARTVNHIDVTFDKTIDPATMTVQDVIVLNGIIQVTGITPMSDVTYRLTLAAALAQGTYQVRIGPNVTDLAGNPMDQDGDGTGGEAIQDAYVVSFVVDRTSPAAPMNVTFEQDGGASDSDGLTAATEVTFTWPAPQDASGIAFYEYSWDGGQWVQTTDAASQPLAAPQGQHTLLLRATDNAGNTGPAASIRVVVDTTPPTAPAGLRMDGAVLFWNQAADANGIWKYQVRVDGGQWTDSPVTQAPTGLADGASGLCEVRAVDRAGNAGPAASATMTADYGPRVVTHWPDALAGAVDHIDLTFNEPVDPATLTAGDVLIGPAIPVLLGTTALPGRGRGIAVDGPLAYVAGYAGGLEILDISGTGPATLLGVCHTNGYAQDVAVSGGLAYLAAGNGGLQIIDVSDPAAPVVVGSYDTDAWAYGVAVAGSLVYLADGDSGLQIIDVSDPSAPLGVGRYANSYSASDVAVVGDTAYLADGSSGLVILDVSNPSSPVRMGGVSNRPAARVAVVGNLAYLVGDEWGFQIVDVSDPFAPALLSTTDLGTSPGPGWHFGVVRVDGLAIDGTRAYLASDDGLAILDVSDPQVPVRLDCCDTAAYAQDVAFLAGRVYVSTLLNGLQVVQAPVYASGVTALSDVTFRFDLPFGLAEGSFDVHISANVTDLAGNRIDQDADGTGGEVDDDTYLFTFQTDATPPSAPTDLGVTDDTGASDSDGLTSDTSLTFTWSAPEDPAGISGYEYRGLGWDGWVRTDDTQAQLTLGAGLHQFQVRAVDIYGRPGAAALLTVNVDTTAPSAPSGLRLDGAALHWNPATDASGIWKYQYRTDGGQWLEAPALQGPTALADGQTASLQVRAVDQAGNIGPAASATLTALYGPRIVSTWPDGTAGPVQHIDLVFDRPIDPASLRAQDVTLLAIGGSPGPDGWPIVSSVTAVDAVTVRIGLSGILPNGQYRVLVSPSITGLTGTAMDQDADGVGGEAVDDAYSADFGVEVAAGLVHVLTPGRAAGRWTFPDADGDRVTITLSGHEGSVSVVRGVATGQRGDAVGLVVDFGDPTAGAGSSITITVRRAGDGDGKTTIGDVEINGSLHAFRGEDVSLAGQFIVTGSLDTLVLDDATGGHRIDIGGDLAPADIDPRDTLDITFDRVVDTSLNAHGLAIGNLTVNEWLAAAPADGADDVPDVIEAARIDRLIANGRSRDPGATAGDFQAGLRLAGDGSPNTLDSATVRGDLSGDWRIDGEIRSITAKGTTDNWSLAACDDGDADGLDSVGDLRLGTVGTADVAVTDVLQSVQAIEWQDGSIQARSIHLLTTTGAGGQFGPDLTLTGGGDAAYTLWHANIAGALGGQWNIDGRVLRILAGGTTDDWTLQGCDAGGTGLDYVWHVRLGTVAQAEVRVGGRLGLLSATQWASGLLQAGDLPTLEISRDFGADLALSGSRGAWAMETGTVGGLVTGNWQIMGGDVRYVRLGAMDGAEILLGCRAVSGDAQDFGTSPLRDLRLHYLRIDGIATLDGMVYFQNSVLAAWRIDLLRFARRNQQASGTWEYHSLAIQNPPVFQGQRLPV